ncbi:unnamed protein product [Effrenium voratum]|nr:unnamed protein product [Effrenium voratum]
MEHLREVTYYENEQEEADSEIRNIRSFQPTEAEHQCLPLHLRNKKLPSRLFSDHPEFVNPPPFPERLGEIVVEAVHHLEKGEPKHIVLEMAGCTSCENDRTRFVEWGGLLSIDESGQFRKMYRKGVNMMGFSVPKDNFGEWHARMGDRKPLVEGAEPAKSSHRYPRKWSADRVPAGEQKYVRTYKYKYSSFQFDETILGDVKTMAAEAATEHSTVDGAFVHEHEAEELKVLREIREQEKRIPFNHKLEQMHMNMYVCEERGAGLICPTTPAETILVHDSALAFDSAKSATFDELGKNSPNCFYGHCSAGERGLTMCSSCTSDRPCGSHSRTQPRGGIEQGTFNCLVERAYTDSGYVDVLPTKPGPTAGGFQSSGFLFRGSGSRAHVTGHINWHLSVPRAGHCEPFLQDVAYVGVGVDECDKCPGGEVDVDIGLVLLSCPLGHTKALGGAVAGQCRYVDHQNFAHRSTHGSYAISEDDRSGKGEGDDEWAFLNLAKMGKSGITHAMVVANIFGCVGGQRPGIGWQDLEGAFMRVTGSSSVSKSFQNAETIGYVDLDGMSGPARNGAALVMFYLSEDSKLAAPSELKRTDGVARTGYHWKMLTVKGTYQGHALDSRSTLEAFGFGAIRNVESDLDRQAAAMSLPTALATEQSPPREEQTIAEVRDVVSHGETEASSVHLASESESERKAKAMPKTELWHKLAATLPEGPPGTDAFCVPSLSGTKI